MSPTRAPTSSFARQVAHHREEKDDAFRYADWSPIDPRARTGFKGLDYYPPDELWRVQATIVRLKEGGTFEMPTSAGEPRVQVRFAKLELDTPGGRASLFAYKDADALRDHALFVPFRDATSGKETYGAGRYLDLEEPARGEVAIDFNLAYSPYCAYSAAYSCPLPPAENWLKIAVTAGEKKFGAQEFHV